MYVDCQSENKRMVVNLSGIRLVDIKDSPLASRIVYEDGNSFEVAKRIAEQVAAALVKSAG
jgi:hypothetical protein